MALLSASAVAEHLHRLKRDGRKARHHLHLAHGTDGTLTLFRHDNLREPLVRVDRRPLPL